MKKTTGCIHSDQQTRRHTVHRRHQRFAQAYLAAQEQSYERVRTRYNLTRLVYFELFESMYTAISREKQIKAGSRKAKIKLIGRRNPGWRDIYTEVCD